MAMQVSFRSVCWQVSPCKAFFFRQIQGRMTKGGFAGRKAYWLTVQVFLKLSVRHVVAGIMDEFFIFMW